MSEALAAPRYPALFRTARAVAESLFSAEGLIPSSDRFDWVAREVEDIAFRAGGRGRLVLRVVAFALSLIAPLFVFKLGGFATMPLPTRTRALERMEASFAAPLVLALKALLCTVWYEHPDSETDVGWTGHRTGRIDRILG